jgi:hypothetical protein
LACAILYLRNVKNFGWNHKRVYRTYRELELNLRIKPRKRLVRGEPELLAVPQAINQVWSMDFMHDKRPALFVKMVYKSAERDKRFNRTVRYEWLPQYDWSSH